MKKERKNKPVKRKDTNKLEKKTKRQQGKMEILLEYQVRQYF